MCIIYKLRKAASHRKTVSTNLADDHATRKVEYFSCIFWHCKCLTFLYGQLIFCHHHTFHSDGKNKKSGLLKELLDYYFFFSFFFFLVEYTLSSTPNCMKIKSRIFVSGWIWWHTHKIPTCLSGRLILKVYSKLAFCLVCQQTKRYDEDSRKNTKSILTAHPLSWFAWPCTKPYDYIINPINERDQKEMLWVLIN